MTRLIFVFVMLMSLSLTTFGQSSKLAKISTNDSVKIQTMIVKFYSWYSDMIKRKKINEEFNPAFVKDEREMTNLDFTNYIKGLRKHNFTDDLIKRRINAYQPCVNNLKAISYNSFIKLELDEHEQIGCDFSNSYEWSGGMEPIDGVELVTLNKLDKHTIESTIRFYNSTLEGIKYYHGSAALKFVQYKNGWMINDFR